MQFNYVRELHMVECSMESIVIYRQVEHKASQHISWVKHSARVLSSYLLIMLLVCTWSTLAIHTEIC